MSWNMKECLENANDFFEIACIVDNKKGEFGYKYLSVFATNLFFSCELYLKYVLMKIGCPIDKFKKEHHLNKLYRILKKGR